MSDDQAMDHPLIERAQQLGIPITDETRVLWTRRTVSAAEAAAMIQRTRQHLAQLAKDRRIRGVRRNQAGNYRFQPQRLLDYWETKDEQPDWLQGARGGEARSEGEQQEHR